jgi:hypothetical protein
MTTYTDDTSLAETPAFTGKFIPAMGYRISAGVGMHGTFAAQYFKGSGGMLDILTIREAMATQFIYHSAMAQGIGIAPRTVVTYALKLASSLGLSSAFSPLASYVLHEKVSFKSAVATTAKMGVSIKDVAGFLALLEFVRSVAISDTIHMHAATPIYAYRAGAAVAELFRLMASPDRALVLHLTLPDSFDLDDAGLCNFIYKVGLDENFTAEITHQHPGDNSVTTWTINTRTTAVTQYSNFAFNSFALMGRKTIAADTNGLYELVGARDDTADITARMAGGFFQPAGGKLAGFKGAYLAVAGQGKGSGATWLLKLDTGDGKSYIYKRVSRPDLQTTKFDIGKGLRSRYFAWELIADDGQDFDLDSLEFVPMVSARRI